MNTEETKEFFACLGEIWRDLAVIEFLMRCAIAKHDGEMSQFPQPPYARGKIYNTFPNSFERDKFSKVREEFNRRFPNDLIPQDLVGLRNGFAHGFIASIGGQTEELVKFKKLGSDMVVDFYMTLDLQTMIGLKQTVSDYRKIVMKLAKD